MSYTQSSRYLIGNMSALAAQLANLEKQSANYPPYNLIETSENTYEVHVAVSGFKYGDLDVSVKDSTLHITGINANGEVGPDVKYLHRGLARRDFNLSFKMLDHVMVTGAELKNGILIVSLERIIPDEMKPRQITIKSE